MICQHCRLEIYGGHHSADWCAGWLTPPVRTVAAAPKPQPVRGQLGCCGRPDCSNPTVPGRVLCGPHFRELKEKNR